MNTKEKYEMGVKLYCHQTTRMQGVALLKEAMQEGSERAALALGVYYLELNAYSAANECFEMGAAKGEKDCLFFLASAYSTPGQGKEVDYVKAYQLLQEAIKRGCKVDDYIFEIYKRDAERASHQGLKARIKKLFGKRA